MRFLAARPLTFFASPKKVSKERRPGCLGPCASLRATCAAPKKRGSAQTRLRLKQVPALIRFALRSSAQTEGVEMECGYRQPDSKQPSNAGALTQARVTVTIDSIAGCAANTWVKGTFDPQTNPESPHLSLSPHPSPTRPGWACAVSKKRDQGRALFERNAVKRVCADPRFFSATQVARSEAQGRRQWGRLFFGDFLLAKQKKVTAPPGALPGSRTTQRHEAKKTSSAYQQSATSYKNRSTHHTAPRRARHRCAHPSNVK